MKYNWAMRHSQDLTDWLERRVTREPHNLERLDWRVRREMMVLCSLAKTDWKARRDLREMQDYWEPQGSRVTAERWAKCTKARLDSRD